MKVALYAVGRAGAHAARSMVEAVMTGLVKTDALSLILIGIGQEDRKSLERLMEAYRRLYREGSELPFFHTPVTALILPEDEMDASLMEKCETKADKLLLSMLFTGDRTLRRSVGSSMETAQTAWADLLHGENAIVQSFEKLDDKNVQVILAASMIEPLGAAGAGQLLKTIRAKAQGPVCGVFGLQIRKKDRTDLTSSGLRELGTETDACYVFGLPEDATTDGDGLEELVGLRCMTDFLAGGRGCFSYACALDTPDWSLFGEQAAQYESSFVHFLHASCLLLLRYGPEAADRLLTGGGLAMRGWYGRVYAATRRDPAYASKEREVLHALTYICRYHVAWCYLTTGNLPMSLRCQAQLRETMLKAGELYDRILEEAGQLSLLSHDLKAAGFLDEEAISRVSSDVTEAEKARRKLTKQAEKVKGLADELVVMEQIMGGRNTLILLEGKAAASMKQAEDLDGQAQEAEKRIQEAARVARPEEMPRVDAARSRLRGLERHLVYVRGQAAYAQRDLEEAREEENRNRPPRAQLAVDDPDVLYERRFLRQLLRMIDDQKDVRRAGQTLLENMQSLDARDIMARFEQNAETAEGTLGLFSALYSLVSETEEGR